MDAGLRAIAAFLLLVSNFRQLCSVAASLPPRTQPPCRRPRCGTAQGGSTTAAGAAAGAAGTAGVATAHSSTFAPPTSQRLAPLLRRLLSLRCLRCRVRPGPRQRQRWQQGMAGTRAAANTWQSDPAGNEVLCLCWLRTSAPVPSLFVCIHHTIFQAAPRSCPTMMQTHAELQSRLIRQRTHPRNAAQAAATRPIRPPASPHCRHPRCCCRRRACQTGWLPQCSTRPVA